MRGTEDERRSGEVSKSGLGESEGGSRHRESWATTRPEGLELSPL